MESIEREGQADVFVLPRVIHCTFTVGLDSELASYRLQHVTIAQRSGTSQVSSIGGFDLQPFAL